MSRTDDLIAAYRRHISLPWPRSAPGAARVIMVVYPPADERIIRLRVQELRLATEQSGHSWDLIDLTDMFAEEYIDLFTGSFTLVSTRFHASSSTDLEVPVHFAFESDPLPFTISQTDPCNFVLVDFPIIILNPLLGR